MGEDSDSRLSEAQLLQGTEKTQHSQKVEVSGRRRRRRQRSRRRRRQRSHSFFKQPAPPPGHTKPPCGPTPPEYLLEIHARNPVRKNVSAMVVHQADVLIAVRKSATVVRSNLKNPC